MEKECDLIYPGRLQGMRLRSCLGLLKGSTINDDHIVAQNVPVYEQAVIRLRLVGREGLSSKFFRSGLCLNGKRSLRVMSELNTVIVRVRPLNSDSSFLL
jgi:hypothetical protein